MRVLIGGSKYGCGNVGDEAALEGMVLDVRSIDPDARITVITKAGKRTRSWLDVDTVGLKSVPGLPWAMLRADRFICGGGTILSDATRYSMALIRLARTMGVPTIMYGVGMEPISDEKKLSLLRNTLRGVPLITVRDEDSKRRLAEAGVDSRVFAAADPALTLAPGERARALEIIKSAGIEPGAGPLAAVAVAGEAHLVERTPVREFVKACRRLVDDHGLNVLFVPMCARPEADVALITRIARETDRPGRVAALAREYYPREIIAVLREVDLVAGSRLHLMILATIAGKPSVAVSRGPKIDSFIAHFDQSPVSGIPDMTAEALVRGIISVWNDRESLALRVRRAHEKMLHECEKSRRLLADWLNDPRRAA